jgi:hypothetical protein
MVDISDISIAITGGYSGLISGAGLSGAVLVFQNGGNDYLELTTPIGPPEDAALGVPFAQIVVTKGEDVIFRGWRDSAPLQRSGTAAAWTWTFVGPSRWLEREPYVPTHGEAGGGVYMAGKKSDGTRLSLKEAIDDVATAFATARPDLLSFDTAGVPEIEIPWQRRRGDTCRVAIEAASRWCPSVVRRWDYSGETPELVFAAPAASSFVLGTDCTIATCAVTPRYDLLRDTIRIVTIGGGKIAFTGGTAVVSAKKSTGTKVVDTWSEVSTDADDLGAAYTYEFACELSPGEPPLAEGLAAEFGAWASKLHIDAAVELPELEWVGAVGDLWGFTGAFSHLSTYTSLCQVIERDLLTGRQRVTLGVPAHLGLGDLIDLSRRDGRLDPSAGAVGYAGGEETGGGGGGGGTAAVETGTLEVSITGLPTGKEGLALWSGPSGVAGRGNGSLEVEADSYDISFAPVYDADDGAWYFAPTDSATVAAGGTGTAVGGYTHAKAAYFEDPADGSRWVKINTDDIPEGADTEIYLREMEICGGQKIVVLASAPYTPA